MRLARVMQIRELKSLRQSCARRDIKFILPLVPELAKMLGSLPSCPDRTQLVERFSFMLPKALKKTSRIEKTLPLAEEALEGRVGSAASRDCQLKGSLVRVAWGWARVSDAAPVLNQSWSRQKSDSGMAAQADSVEHALVFRIH